MVTVELSTAGEGPERATVAVAPLPPPPLMTTLGTVWGKTKRDARGGDGNSRTEYRRRGTREGHRGGPPAAAAAANDDARHRGVFLGVGSNRESCGAHTEAGGGIRQNGR